MQCSWSLQILWSRMGEDRVCEFVFEFVCMCMSCVHLFVWEAVTDRTSGPQGDFFFYPWLMGRLKLVAERFSELQELCLYMCIMCIFEYMHAIFSAEGENLVSLKFQFDDLQYKICTLHLSAFFSDGPQVLTVLLRSFRSATLASCTSSHQYITNNICALIQSWLFFKLYSPDHDLNTEILHYSKYLKQVENKQNKTTNVNLKQRTTTSAKFSKYSLPSGT